MPTQTFHILFLAHHVQPFLQSGIEALLKDEKFKVTVIAKSWDKDWTHPGLEVIAKKEVTHELLQAFTLQAVVCAGWSDQDYIKWSSYNRAQNYPVICCMDTPWKASAKQHLHLLLAPYTTLTYFTHAWVPGPQQYLYAQKLGWADNKILQHLLAIDTHTYSSDFNLPPARRFVYYGRLIERKLKTLLLAYQQLEATERWPLLIIGDGPFGSNALMKTKGIQHVNFLPQEKLLAELKQGGVFVLCAIDEPWGTSIQEAACLGMPLIVSRQCGAAATYVQDGINGFTVNGSSVNNITTALQKMMQSSDEQRTAMGVQSKILGKQPDNIDWCNELKKVVLRQP